MLSDIASFDAKSLPEEVLQSMYSTLLSEIRRRRTCKSIVNRNSVQAWHRSSLKRLDDLIAADWSSIYPENDGEAKFYVYAHVYPYGNYIKHDGKFKLNLPGMPFYIGKGVGDRAWDLKRNEGHGVALRELHARGFGKEKIVHLLAEGLTESKAFEIEAKLISFFGTKFQSERRGVLLNLDMPKTLNY